MSPCVSVEFNSLWLCGGSCRVQMFLPQLVSARGHVDSAQRCFFGGPEGQAPWAFPVSFCVRVDPGSARNFLGREPLPTVPRRWAVGGPPEARRASGWTFTFLLFQSPLDVAGGQKNPHFPPAPAKAWVASATAQEGAHGLQTVLALLSPGFCRLWGKRWHHGHRALGPQAPTLLRLARGLKALKEAPAAAPADPASSVPCALGKDRSLWSQRGLPTLGPPAPGPLPLLPVGSCCKWGAAPGAAPANPSLRNDSCAAWPPGRGQGTDVSLMAKEEVWWRPLPFPRPVPRPCPGLSAPGFHARGSDEGDPPAPTLQLPFKSDTTRLKKRPQKVSQIRIRKAVPRPDPNLTPMGLPRPKRLKKTEFSLEEIYTNQNYRSPPATRCLETIFEEPKERNGALVAVSHQKRKRVLEFQDFTLPRKRKARGGGGRTKVAGSFTRAQRAASEGRALDLLLIQRLAELEAFLAQQEGGGDADR